MRRRRGRNLLPLAYLAGAALVAVTVLPSSLRPPPDQTNAASALSPDAPDDEDPETIIQSLQQAGSRTAGASGGDAAPTTTTTITYKPSRGQCYGDPPRAFDSVYAPPCEPAFTGDNGGKTAPRGVNATEIRIGLSPDLSGVRDCGEIPDTATAEENDTTRTYRVLRDFFNQNLELYGRKMRWFYSCAPDGTAGEEAERARGVRLAEEFRVFASIGEFSGFVADEATRREVVHFANIVVVGDDFYANRTPYLWGSRTNATKAVDFGSTYLCKRLVGNVPFPTGDKLIDYTKPRKFGILSLDSKDTHAALVDMQTKLEQRCGLTGDDVPVATYNLDQDASSNNSGGIATAMARLKAAGVTTVVFMGEIISLPIHAQQADRNDYYPEWYLMGYGGFETAVDLTRTVSPTQWQHAFGFSFEEIPLRPAETPCWRAYKSLDPANNPNGSICNVLFHSMTFLFGSIQEAGPDLNVDTLTQGLWRAFRRPAEPVWSMGGGFSPTDYTYGDYAVELWWSPTAIHPDTRPGAYVYPKCGLRFSLDTIGEGQPDYMFQDRPDNTTYGLDAGPGCEGA